MDMKFWTMKLPSNRSKPITRRLEVVLLDFLTSDSASFAASTGSILRTIKCVEQARLQLTAQGRSKTRELKR